MSTLISTNNPHRCGGKPTIKDTRITVELIQSLGEKGYAPHNIQDLYPQLSPAQIQAAIDYPLTAQERFPHLPTEIADAYYNWLKGADETCPDDLDTEDVYAAGYTAGKATTVQPAELPERIVRFNRIHALIDREIERQDAKWGTDRDLGGLLWNAVLAEEVGEVSKAILYRDHQNLRYELIQVAAVCCQWLANIDRYAEQGRLYQYDIRGGDAIEGRDAE